LSPRSPGTCGPAADNDECCWRLNYEATGFFALNGLLYVAYTLLSGQWRYLVPNRHSFREAIQVALHDLHLSKIVPPPRKFNGAQQIAYTAIVLMGAGSLVTGVAIYKPVQFAWLTAFVGGYEWARWEHFWLAVGYVLFFRDPRRAGGQSRLERLPCDGHRLRDREREHPILDGETRFEPTRRGKHVMSGRSTPHEPVIESDLNVARVMRYKSRRSFLVTGISAAAGVAGWKWLRTRPEVGDLPYPLRRTLEFNERLAESYFNESRLAPTFPREMAREPRVNGEEGLSDEFDPLAWRL
jgi:hypothetical protein